MPSHTYTERVRGKHISPVRSPSNWKELRFATPEPEITLSTGVERTNQTTDLLQYWKKAHELTQNHLSTESKAFLKST